MRTRAAITSLLLGTPRALHSLQAHSEPDFPKKWLKSSWRIDALPESDVCGVLPATARSFDSEIYFRLSREEGNPTTSIVTKDDKQFDDPIGEISFALESYEDEKMCAEAAAHLMKALGGTFVEASNAYDILLEKLCFRYNSVKA
ncbi:hypothetical protein FOZ60_007776 [Perkinsus olseni]|uniref:Uncharacterized protein n=1 Tax=Perkinsus olseni TaxID=32597 RepID=A0A7J6PGL9_PEROL|nr:hypothetical protein FOZ60_007776 [Perkinsus olseni]